MSDDIDIGDSVFIELHPRIYTGKVIWRDRAEIQVETECAAIISRMWTTLVFRADTLTSYVGQAKILQPETVMEFMELRKRAEGG